jgi:hypothetical protein
MNSHIVINRIGSQHSVIIIYSSNQVLSVIQGYALGACRDSRDRFEFVLICSINKRFLQIHKMLVTYLEVENGKTFVEASFTVDVLIGRHKNSDNGHDGSKRYKGRGSRICL